MKKLIFSAAVLMMGAVAFAQTSTQGSEADFQDTALTAPIVDITMITTADAIMGSPADANKGYSKQTATIPAAMNMLKVLQAGEKNSTVNFQNGAGNKVSMRQTGNVNGNQADSGEKNLIYNNQIGDNNDGRLEQQGDRNEAILVQDNSPFAGTVGNRADIQQGVANQAEKNFAAIDQWGDDNDTKILQTFDNSDAFVVQAGERNMVEINQRADPENSQGHEALVEQFGDDNQALVNQNADGKKGRNYARVFSFGDNNKSMQTQTTDSNTKGNTALVNQGIGAGFAPTLFNAAEYTKLQAIDNVMNAGANAASTYSEAIQDQKGHDNVAESHQFGLGTSAANGDYTKQSQDGKDNEAYAFQNAYGNANGRGNHLDTDQLGDDNYVGTAQNGRGHDITVSQVGDDNEALSTQRGRGHIVDIRQTGDKNFAHTAQRGVGNSVVITQNGGHSFLSEQDVPGGFPNGGNFVDVIQVGPMGTPQLNTGQTPAAVAKMAITAPAGARASSSL